MLSLLTACCFRLRRPLRLARCPLAFACGGVSSEDELEEGSRAGLVVAAVVSGVAFFPRARFRVRASSLARFEEELDLELLGSAGSAVVVVVATTVVLRRSFLSRLGPFVAVVPIGEEASGETS